MLRVNSETHASVLREANNCLLVLDKVTKDYVTDGEPVRALHDVSFEVATGQFLALVGRSGCGKSTLLNLGGAMDFPTSGQVLVDGISTTSLSNTPPRVFLRVHSKTNSPVTFFITIRGDLHHCVGVPIAAIKMLIDAAFRNGT
jgi:ABC-type glutathione transport system ATPase component